MNSFAMPPGLSCVDVLISTQRIRTNVQWNDIAFEIKGARRGQGLWGIAVWQMKFTEFTGGDVHQPCQRSTSIVEKMIVHDPA